MGNYKRYVQDAPPPPENFPGCASLTCLLVVVAVTLSVMFLGTMFDASTQTHDIPLYDEANPEHIHGWKTIPSPDLHTIPR